MMTRDPLTPELPTRYPRTLRDMDADPRAWWASAEAEAANEAYIREMFADEKEPRSWVLAHRVIYAITVVVVMVFVWDLWQ